MFLLAFEIECRTKTKRGDEGALLHRMKTGFGFFPRNALAQQVGLPTSDAERSFIEQASEGAIDLDSLRRDNEGPRLPGGRILMFDRVSGYWPTAGKAGLGRLRAEKDIRPDEWFFKAHFFQDPVQPGSLGLEAMLQLLRVYMLERGLGRGLARPRFEAISSGRPVVWKYRGQVVPENGRVTVEIEIVAAGHDDKGPYAGAEAWLWVDGRRIYHATGLGMRIVSE
jgi:3-hydroxymyristoyl/3-hydroxydecanoyl-(acyl carrier protein) dehydratase